MIPFCCYDFSMLDLTSAGSFKLKLASGGSAQVDVSTCVENEKNYHVVRIQRECLERVSGLLSGIKVDSSEFDDRREYFPSNTEAFASRSGVVIRNDDNVFCSEVVDFGKRKYWSAALPGIVEKVSIMVKSVFDNNPDLSEVFVMIDSDGEKVENCFEGTDPLDEETGEF